MAGGVQRVQGRKEEMRLEMRGSAVKVEAKYYENPVKYPVKTILRISLFILSKMEPLEGF